MYELITQDEVDHLKELISTEEGIAYLQFYCFQEDQDEDIIALANDGKVKKSELNPFLLAVKHKSFNCIKHFISEHKSLR